jgi:hypothetical protein
MIFFETTETICRIQRASLKYASDETELRRFVARVLGGDWRHAPKRGELERRSEQSPGERLLSDE